MNLNEVEILLVEDNSYDAELTLRSLKKHHLANRVLHVHDGAEALDFIFAEGAYSERVIENTPRIILLDLNLPKIDGFEVLERIKCNELTKNIPVVVMTSSRDDVSIQKCYELGANSCIVKSVEFDSFVKVTTDLGFYWLLVNQASNQ